jgi:hypothetical protein
MLPTTPQDKSHPSHTPRHPQALEPRSQNLPTTTHTYQQLGAWRATRVHDKIDQSGFTSRVLGLICDSEARTAIESDGQHIGAFQELQALKVLQELLDIM